MLTNLPTWTTDRVELLKNHFEAGLTCREIAANIGVSRNAVIGKLSRLGLTRGPARAEPRPKKPPGSAPGNPSPDCSIRSCRPSTKTTPPLQEEPIASDYRCSLLELSNERCRWPISTPGAEDFCFCGNTPVKACPIALGITASPTVRARASACVRGSGNRFA